MKKRLITLGLITTILFSSSSVLGCTGTIVGKKVAADGHTILGRTEDYSSAYNKNIIVTPRKTYKDGEMFEDANGLKLPQPKESYKFTSIPDGYQDEGDVFDAAGFNEFGVAMTATVTAYAHEKAYKADPLVEKGLTESSITGLVLPRVKTAREGIELVAKIIDKHGSSEGNIIFISDQKETWYMEMLTGHQYVAVKYPEDCFSVVPNCYMLGSVDIKDKENVIASKDLVNLPKKNGFLVMEDGKIHVRKTYAEELSPYNRSRLWGGINFLDKDKNIAFEAEEFELFQKTDKKISVKDVMEMQRYRYEGTKYDANLPANENIRAIGTINQEECHVLEVREDYPKSMGGIIWVAMGNSEHSIYVPVIGGITDTTAQYKVTGNMYTPNSAYWTLRGVSALSEINRDKYGVNVRKYWNTEELRLLKEQKDVDKKLKDLYKKDEAEAIKYVDSLAKKNLTKAYKDATTIYKELNTYFLRDSGKKQEKAYVPSLIGGEMTTDAPLEEAVKH